MPATPTASANVCPTRQKKVAAEAALSAAVGTVERTTSTSIADASRSLASKEIPQQARDSNAKVAKAATDKTTRVAWSAVSSTSKRQATSEKACNSVTEHKRESAAVQVGTAGPNEEHAHSINRNGAAPTAMQMEATAVDDDDDDDDDVDEELDVLRSSLTVRHSLSRFCLFSARSTDPLAAIPDAPSLASKIPPGRRRDPVATVDAAANWGRRAVRAYTIQTVTGSTLRSPLSPTVEKVRHPTIKVGRAATVKKYQFFRRSVSSESETNVRSSHRLAKK